MKKRYIATAAGAVGAGITGYILKNAENLDEIKSKLKTVAEKIRNGENDRDLDITFEDAGAPDQMKQKDMAQLENSKMVSEGSQFGVEYYNKVKEEQNEKLNS